MRLKKGRVTCAGYVLLLCQSNQMFPWKNVFFESRLTKGNGFLRGFGFRFKVDILVSMSG